MDTQLGRHWAVLLLDKAWCNLAIGLDTISVLTIAAIDACWMSWRWRGGGHAAGGASGFVVYTFNYQGLGQTYEWTMF